MTMRGMVVSWSPRRRGVSPLNRWGDIAFVHITQLASVIESDPSQVEEWYRSVCIREFGGKTARELVKQGHAGLVIRFLRSIRGGERD